MPPRKKYTKPCWVSITKTLMSSGQLNLTQPQPMKAVGKKVKKCILLELMKTEKKGGMISEIAENIPSKFVSIRHYGILDGDHEITSGEQVEKWAGSLENYSLTKNNGVTTVEVELDTDDNYADYFNNTWPKALNKLKEISENQ